MRLYLYRCAHTYTQEGGRASGEGQKKIHPVAICASCRINVSRVKSVRRGCARDTHSRSYKYITLGDSFSSAHMYIALSGSLITLSSELLSSVYDFLYGGCITVARELCVDFKCKSAGGNVAICFLEVLSIRGIYKYI